MRCQCVSVDCGNRDHTGLECEAEGNIPMQSRDFGDERLKFCAFCAKDARIVGMFE